MPSFSSYQKEMFQFFQLIILIYILFINCCNTRFIIPDYNFISGKKLQQNSIMRNIIKSSLSLSRLIRPIPLYLYSTQLKFSQKTNTTLFNFNKFSFGSQAQKKTDHLNISKSSYQGPGFYMEQMLTGCLAIYSYYIQSENDAFLIDPLNETQKYSQIIKSRGKSLKGVFLTHYHADYIAGHLQLKKKYNCQIYIGPKGLSTHGIKVLKDGEELKVGNVKLRTIHTPGHTEQSSCLLLVDSNNKQQCIFTGDTLFLNEVGRPDLAVKSDLSSSDLAGMLFDSLQKIKVLKDDIRVYPGHGSGSACGKSIGKGDFCTLGTQKKNNYGLKQTVKQKFVKQVLHQMPKPPDYFGYNAGINKFQPFNYDEAHSNTMKRLSSQQAKDLIKKQKATVVDVRSIKQLQQGIIKGALTIDFDGAFANWAGTLLNPKQKYIIYGPEQTAKQSIKRLLRIGYVNILGYCSSNIKPDFVPSIITEGRKIIDVRKPAEWAKGIAAGDVTKLQITNLFADHSKALNKSQKYVVHCQSGYRARIAYSFLKSQGYDVKVMADGGYNKFESLGIKTVRND